MGVTVTTWCTQSTRTNRSNNQTSQNFLTSGFTSWLFSPLPFVPLVCSHLAHWLYILANFPSFSQLAISSLLSISPRECAEVIARHADNRTGLLLYGVFYPDWINWTGIPEKGFYSFFFFTAWAQGGELLEKHNMTVISVEI